MANTKSNESNENPKQSGVTGNLISAFKKLLPTINDRNSEKDQATRNFKLLQSFRDRKTPTVYRVHPMPSVNAVEGNEFDEIARCPYHVFISRNQAPEFPGSSDSAICRIKKIPENKQHVNVTSTNFLTKDESPVPKFSTELVVKVFILEDFLEKFSALDRNHFNVDFRHRSMYVSNSLRVSLSLKVGAKVSLCLIDMSETPKPSSIELFSWRNSVTIEDFKNYVKTRSFYKKLLINTCAAIVLDNGNCCIVKISPEDYKFAMITEDNLSDVRIHTRNVKEESQLRISEHFDQECLSLGMTSTRYCSLFITEISNRDIFCKYTYIRKITIKTHCHVNNEFV